MGCCILEVRFSTKLRVHREVWFFIGDRSFDVVAIFQEEQVAKKWSRRGAESAFSEGSPNIFGAAHSFL